MLLVVLGFFTLVCAGASLAAGYVLLRIEQVERLSVADALTQAPPAPLTADQLVIAEPSAPAVALEGSSSEPGFDDVEVFRPDRPAENYLLVGSDSVEGVSADDPMMEGRQNDVGNSLADTIMILRLRPDGSAAVVSIPRDLLVRIAGTTTVSKINSAFNFNEDPASRATRLINTVEEHLDVRLQHFVEIDLDGFRKLVDAVGGVEVVFESAIRDQRSGFSAPAGRQLLDGERALQYVRSRRLFVEGPDGNFERLGVSNDIERAARQQQFLFDAVDQVLDDVLSSPGTLRSILDIVAANVRTSDTISLLDDGLDLARTFRGFDADAGLERYALELRDASEGSLTGLALRSSEHNERVLDVFRGIGWDDVVEDRVTVSVVGSGSGVVAQALQDIGFVIDWRSDVAQTDDGPVRVRYGVGGQLAAVLVASHIRTDVTFEGDRSLNGNTIVLDLAGADGQTVEVSPDYRLVELPPEVAATVQSTS